MEAATACRGLKPWEWMHEGDIFGVKDAESGGIGYSCIMGNAGEVYALGVYLDDEGFKLYQLEFCAVTQREGRYFKSKFFKGVDTWVLWH